MPYSWPVIFVESTVFERYLPDHLSDEEYADLQADLIDHPESGTLIRGGGGVRKKRWRLRGTGKRGGARIIYYVHTEDCIWMITIYAKSEIDSIPAKYLRQIKEEMEDG